MSTRAADRQTLTSSERRVLWRLGVLKVEWNPFGSHFILGSTSLRLSDLRKAAAAMAKLLAAELGREPKEIGVKFDVNEDFLFVMTVQLPGGSSHGDRTFNDDKIRALLDKYLDPKYTGIGNPSIEVVRDTATAKFMGLMAHVPVVRGEAKTLDVTAMLAVSGVMRVSVQEKSISNGAVVRARLDTRDAEEARAIVRALSDALGLEVAGDIMLKDPRPELALFDGDPE